MVRRRVRRARSHRLARYGTPPSPLRRIKVFIGTGCGPRGSSMESSMFLEPTRRFERRTSALQARRYGLLRRTNHWRPMDFGSRKSAGNRSEFTSFDLISDCQFAGSGRHWPALSTRWMRPFGLRECAPDDVEVVSGDHRSRDRGRRPKECPLTGLLAGVVTGWLEADCCASTCREAATCATSPRRIATRSPCG